MSAAYPKTHDAVVTPAPRAPLEILQVPTVPPGAGEVVVRVKWASSSPVDLHQADSTLLVQEHPFILGCGFAGIVVAEGPEDPYAKAPISKPVTVGDRVFGFTPPEPKMQAFQTYITVRRNLLGRVPENLTMEAAVTVPTNLVTAFFVTINDLGLDLRWPIPAGWKPSAADAPILIWGGASSVGLFTIQILSHWGYNNIVAVASSKHHDELRGMGARECFDYRDADVTDKINARTAHFPYVIDCIGQLDGSLQPLTRIAKSGTTLAVMLPLIVRDSTEDEEPLLAYNFAELLRDRMVSGVDVKGTATFFYEKNDGLKWHCQPDIVPELLATGVVKPNRQRIVDGDTLLERAQKAMDLLRQRAPSGERLVWRVSEE